MKTSRPIRARIAPAAILHNYRLAKSHAPQAKAWAVVKANAYGHGQWRAVESLRSEADGFALLECENAVALREAGVTQPILLLEGGVVLLIDDDQAKARRVQRARCARRHRTSADLRRPLP